MSEPLPFGLLPPVGWLSEPDWPRPSRDVAAGVLPTALESVAAALMGCHYGPDALIAASDLRVLCKNCGRRILVVTLIGRRRCPLVTAYERGDRLVPARELTHHYEFSWLDRGTVSHARCNRRYEFVSAELLQRLPGPGSHRVDLVVSHDNASPIVH